MSSRISFAQWGSALAILISTLALVVAIYEANLLKEQQRSMVWPYVNISMQYNAEGFRVQAENDGIGPALIHSIEIRHEGRALTSWFDVLDHLQPGHSIGYDILQSNALSGTVLKAGEVKTLMGLPWRADTRPLAEQINQLDYCICYCSVLDECWMRRSEDEMPQPGKASFETPFED